ncbi:MAG: nucleotidyltransferase domain-containing protein [Anaerolineae bacterium]|nr:nucleotidyltransferase domain-containing protein [Anaerolineae bacterium]
MEQIANYCRRWKITELALFGSVLTDRFRPDSDVDVLVTFELNSRVSLFDFMHAEEDLSRILGHPVDLAERSAIENSYNYIIRQSILESAQDIYGFDLITASPNELDQAQDA